MALINKGKLVDVADLNAIKNRPVTDFKIEFNNRQDYEDFKSWDII